MFELVLTKNEKTTVASLKCGINTSTAQGYVRTAKAAVGPLLTSFKKTTHQQITHLFQLDMAAVASNGTTTPTVGELRRGNQKLYSEHDQFLVQLFAIDQYATLKSACEALSEKFPGLTMSPSGLRSHLLKKCCLVVKSFGHFGSCTEDETFDNWSQEDTIFVGAMDWLVYKRTRFGWSIGRRNDGEPLSAVQGGVFVPLLVAFSKTGIHQVSVVTPTAVLQPLPKGSFRDVEVDWKRTKLYLKFFDTLTKNLNPITSFTFAVCANDIYGSRRVQELMDQNSNRMVLVPDTPFKRLWKRLELAFPRQELSSSCELLQRITDTCAKITSDDCGACLLNKQ